MNGPNIPDRINSESLWCFVVFLFFVVNFVAIYIHSFINQTMASDRLNLENDVKKACELIDKLQKVEYNAWLSRFVIHCLPVYLIKFFCLFIILAIHHWKNWLH